MVSTYVRNWMDGADFEFLKLKIGKKPVYLLGKSSDEAEVIRFLKEKGIEITKQYDSVNEAESFIFTNENFFIVYSINDEGIMEKLKEHHINMKKNLHTIWQRAEITYVDGYYCDEHGNEIICEGEMRGITVCMTGHGNRLVIGKNVWAEDVTINMKGNADFVISDEVGMEKGIIYMNNSKSFIGEDSWLGSNFFISNFNGELNIGKYFSALDGLYMCCVENTVLSIGEECMFAKNVKILSGGAHSLFDLDKKININIAEDVHVKIGNHVWIGMDSSVIYNSDIGSHSMVGAMSLVKGSYPSNVVIAGHIAKVIRENIDWDRRDYMTYPEYEKMLKKRKRK